MIINISTRSKDYEFYNVPEKIGKAIITILQGCQKDNSQIFSLESEDRSGNTINALEQEPMNERGRKNEE